METANPVAFKITAVSTAPNVVVTSLAEVASFKLATKIGSALRPRSANAAINASTGFRLPA